MALVVASSSLALQWGAVAALAIMGLYVIAMNWSIVRVAFARRRHHSWVPLAGGTLCALAMWSAPIPGIRAWIWIPFLLDFGCIPGLAMTAWYSLRPTRPSDQHAGPS